jgi:hypothetical protein
MAETVSLLFVLEERCEVSIKDLRDAIGVGRVAGRLVRNACPETGRSRLRLSMAMTIDY